MDTDALWGGALTSLSLDPISWALRAEVETTSEGTLRRYVLVLDEIVDLHAKRTVPLPWTNAELTEVHVSEAPVGVVVELVLWADDTALTVRCTRARVSLIR
jgi:hypothetical protein